jgi:hypothetical protein
MTLFTRKSTRINDHSIRELGSAALPWNRNTIAAKLAARQLDLTTLAALRLRKEALRPHDCVSKSNDGLGATTTSRQGQLTSQEQMLLMVSSARFGAFDGKCPSGITIRRPLPPLTLIDRLTTSMCSELAEAVA